jgi:hypothetical protein
MRTVLQWLVDPRQPSQPLDTALNARDEQLTNRSHALLRAAAALRNALATKDLSDEAAQHPKGDSRQASTGGAAPR